MAVSRDDPRIGTRFAGRYDIVGILGEGGMGIVYEARHAFTSRPIALKIVHSVVARSTQARERFLREAQASTSVGHPGIVEVLDAGVADDGSPYLALELLRGENLAHGIARGSIDVARMVAITIELLGALGAAHRAGLVHRDIKPENVFLAREDGRERVRLLDFGITRSVHDSDAGRLTRTGTVLGTPHYMSPEQARGQPVDARSDLFSVGGMLFHGLTGRTPFEGTNYNVLVVSIMTGRAPYIRTVRPDLPEDLAAVIDCALEPDPAARFASAEAMQNALRSCRVPHLPAPAPDAALSATLASEDITANALGQRGRANDGAGPGVTTAPEPAATPPTSTPARSVPPTSATPAYEPSRGRARWPLLVVALLAAVGGAAAAAILLRAAPVAPPSPLSEGPVPVTPIAEPNSAPMVPSESATADVPTMEGVEEQAQNGAEAQAAEDEAQAAEEEARRARARRAREKRLADAAAAARQRCNSACSMEFHLCVTAPEARADSAGALRCHQQMQICTLRCE